MVSGFRFPASLGSSLKPRDLEAGFEPAPCRSRASRSATELLQGKVCPKHIKIFRLLTMFAPHSIRSTHSGFLSDDNILGNSIYDICCMISALMDTGNALSDSDRLPRFGTRKKSYQRVVPIGVFVIEIPPCAWLLIECYSKGRDSDNTFKRKEFT